MSSSDLRHKYSCSGQTLPINLLSKEYRGTNLYHTLDSPVALQYIPYMNDYVVVTDLVWFLILGILFYSGWVSSPGLLEKWRWNQDKQPWDQWEIDDKQTLERPWLSDTLFSRVPKEQVQTNESAAGRLWRWG